MFASVELGKDSQGRRLIPAAQCYQFRWCRRDKTYYGNTCAENDLFKKDTQHWYYWFDDWFRAVMAAGVPLDHIQLVHELQALRLDVLPEMPMQLKHLMQKRTRSRLNTAAFCATCRDWFPTAQMRYICPHLLNCTDCTKTSTRTITGGCGEKPQVKEACRKYNTCFADLLDSEREALIKSLNKERNRKHGWAKRLANKPLIRRYLPEPL